MIQKAQPEDWIKIRTLCEKELSSFTLETWNPTSFDHCFLYQDEQIKGVIFYQILYERAELDYIVVEKENQHTGIGSKLMNYFLEDCQNRNVETISLEVSEQNQKAILFYQKFGFQGVSRRAHYYKEGDAILMVKKVKQ